MLAPLSPPSEIFRRLPSVPTQNADLLEPNHLGLSLDSVLEIVLQSGWWCHLGFDLAPSSCSSSSLFPSGYNHHQHRLLSLSLSYIHFTPFIAHPLARSFPPTLSSPAHPYIHIFVTSPLLSATMSSRPQNVGIKAMEVYFPKRVSARSLVFRS